MKIMTRVLAAAMVTVLSAGGASATVFTYDVAGTFSNGRVLGGSFTFDDTKPSYDQFTNLAVTISGLGTFSDIKGLGYGSDFYEVAASTANNAYRVTVAFDGTSDNAVLKSVDGPLLDSNETYYTDGQGSGGVNLLAGTITRQVALPTVAAVPEPATWAMMILGMGAVGFAMRRRKDVSTSVKFA